MVNIRYDSLSDMDQILQQLNGIGLITQEERANITEQEYDQILQQLKDKGLGDSPKIIGNIREDNYKRAMATDYTTLLSQIKEKEKREDEIFRKFSALASNITVKGKEVEYRTTDDKWVSIPLDEYPYPAELQDITNGNVQVRLLRYIQGQLQNYLGQIRFESDSYNQIKDNPYASWKDDILVYVAACTKRDYPQTGKSLKILDDIFKPRKNGRVGLKAITENGNVRKIAEQELRAYGDADLIVKYAQARFMIKRIYDKMVMGGIVEKQTTQMDITQMYQVVRRHWDKFLQRVIEAARTLSGNLDAGRINIVGTYKKDLYADSPAVVALSKYIRGQDVTLDINGNLEMDNFYEAVAKGYVNRQNTARQNKQRREEDGTPLGNRKSSTVFTNGMWVGELNGNPTKDESPMIAIISDNYEDSTNRKGRKKTRRSKRNKKWWFSKCIRGKAR